MQKPKTGGNSPIRILIKGNDDITNSLLSKQEGGQSLERGLGDLVQEKYQGAFRVEIMHEPCQHSGLLLQYLERFAVPERLPQPKSAGETAARAPEFQSRLFEAGADVLVLSIQPDVVCPDSQVEPFKENLSRFIRAVKERLGAHIIVYNASSVDPDDHVHNYYGLEDTLAVRVQKFNLALIELSILEGISIINVDRLIAELDGGGGRHVVKALRYSTEAYQALCQEFLRVLEDIGFFEKRPLVMQIGQRRNGNVVKA